MSVRACGREANQRAHDLYAALDVLRATNDPASPENARHWAVVDRYVGVAVGEQGPDADDDRQNVMLAIVAHASTMRA